MNDASNTAENSQREESAVYIKWYKNGILISSLTNNAVLDPINTKKDETKNDIFLKQFFW